MTTTKRSTTTKSSSAPSVEQTGTALGAASGGVTTIDQFMSGVANKLSQMTGKTISATGNNLTALETWARAEGGGTSAQSIPAYNNPLNTTEPGYGRFISGGNPAYPTVQQGVDATAATIEQYPHVLADLVANAAPTTTEKDIENSPWASSHYGGALASSQAPSSEGSVPLEEPTGYSGGGIRTGARGKTKSVKAVGPTEGASAPSGSTSSGSSGSSGVLGGWGAKLVAGLLGCALLIVGVVVLTRGSGSGASSPSAPKTASAEDEVEAAG